MDQEKIDECFMLEALKEAKIAFELDEVPIGAVLVHRGEVVARGHNLVESGRSATFHAEFLCLQRAAEVLKSWRLLETTLYSTLEPCPMCAGAMILSRIQTLVWAAPDLRCGADGSWIELLAKPHPIHQIRIRSGICKSASSQLMQQFFQKKRGEKSNGKDLRRTVGSAEEETSSLCKENCSAYYR